jgi:hypothetical protein
LIPTKGALHACSTAIPIALSKSSSVCAKRDAAEGITILRDHVRRIRQPKRLSQAASFRAMELTEFSAIQAAKQVWLDTIGRGADHPAHQFQGFLARTAEGAVLI